MATQVGYKLQRKDFVINSIEDIDRMLDKNNIIPTYEGHLLKLNTCIDMFEKMEKNRSLCEIFCDFAAGKRKKINCKRLLDHLIDVKEEFLKGIKIYMMLLGQREEVRKYLRNLKVTKFKLDETKTDIPKTSPVKKVAIPAIIVGSFTIASTVVGGGGAILAHYAGIVIPLGTLISTKAVAIAVTTAATAATAGGIGAAVGFTVIVGVAAAIFMIYKIAQYKGKERGLKYQQVKELYDALDDRNVLSTIRTNHEELESIFNAINKQLNTDEAYMQMALGVYLGARETSLRELKQDNPEMSAKMRSIMSEKNATTACETYLRHKVQYSEEKIQCCIETIRRDQTEKLNQENDPANDVPEHNPEIQGQEQNAEIQGQEQNAEIQGQEQNAEIQGQEQNAENQGQEQNAENQGQEQNAENQGEEHNAENLGQNNDDEN